MSDFTDFASTLENKIREQILEELQLLPEEESRSNEVCNEAGYQHLGWLLGQAPRLMNPSSFQRSAYVRFQKPLIPRPNHVLDQKQIKAFELIKSYCQDLAANFTRKDLKKSYRKALLRVHPDHGGHAQSFWSVREAYNVLMNIR